MKKMFAGSALVFSTIGTIAYIASHISAAVIAFQNFKLWVALVMLLVPLLGDGMAIFAFIKLHTWWPFILYAACLICWGIGSSLASKADE